MTDELPLRIEAKELEGANRQLTTSVAEIRQLFQQLSSRQEMACVYVGENDRFTLTSIVGIEDGKVILEGNGDETMPTDISQARSLTCVSVLNRVKIQFESIVVAAISQQDTFRLKIALPQQVIRLQRRDFYRMNVPGAQPLSCFLPCGDEEIEISLFDISIGGLGLVGFVPGLSTRAGAIYHGARIELPDAGTVVADIEIRSSFDITLPNGIRTIRTGAQFVNLTGTMQSLIQKYITRIERGRLAVTQRAV
jgi:c-di-GMP-binding flagellar brake protein YcgR